MLQQEGVRRSEGTRVGWDGERWGCRFLSSSKCGRSRVEDKGLCPLTLLSSPFPPGVLNRLTLACLEQLQHPSFQMHPQ